MARAQPNRVVKWATERLNLTFGMAAGQATATRADELFASIDVNNTPSQVPLPPEQGLALLEETFDRAAQSINAALGNVEWIPND